MKFLKDKFLSEDGAVTIDWVVLTAGIVMLGLSVGVGISTPASGLASDINAEMSTMAPLSH